MGKIYDVTLGLNSEIVVWEGNKKPQIKAQGRIVNGQVCNDSNVEFNVHTGTHIDAPWHFIESGKTVESLKLSKMLGDCFLLDLSRMPGKVVDAKVLESSKIPKNCKKLLIKTQNSKLWENPAHEFRKDFVAIDSSASSWLVKRKIETIGVDYLSVQLFGDKPDTHLILLTNEVLIIEGLDLRKVKQGSYELMCLPLKFEGLDGAPARVILRK